MACGVAARAQVGRRFRCRRRHCPDCGSRATLVRYERGVMAGGAVRAPVELRCTNRACERYWG